MSESDKSFLPKVPKCMEESQSGPSRLETAASDLSDTTIKILEGTSLRESFGSSQIAGAAKNVITDLEPLTLIDTFFDQNQSGNVRVEFHDSRDRQDYQLLFLGPFGTDVDVQVFKDTITNEPITSETLDFAGGEPQLKRQLRARLIEILEIESDSP